MMIATWVGTTPWTRTRWSRSSPVIRQTSMISASFAWMRPSICLMWSSVSFWTSFSARVLSSLGDVLELLDPGDRVGARVAHGDPALLGELVDDLDQLLAPLLRERRERDPDQVALRRRVEAEPGVADGLLDRVGERLVERLDREEPGLRSGDHRHLIERNGAAVGFDPHRVEQGGVALLLRMPVNSRLVLSTALCISSRACLVNSGMVLIGRWSRCPGRPREPA